ncbi:MAG: hypothetical protein GY915_03690, partial [bacterium]|nr:hypothetical protein [bacterium]
NLKTQKVDSVAEVYQMAPALFQEADAVIVLADAVIVLKDHTVVSAMTAVVALAKKRGNKLVIAMDDGSVRAGAPFALGVPEVKIGEEAGHALVSALRGEDAEAFRERNFENLSLFYNPRTLEAQNLVSLDQLKVASQKAGYTLEAIECQIG